MARLASVSLAFDTYFTTFDGDVRDAPRRNTYN